jgi:pilus assembly protein Flp/PilA
VVFCRSRVFPHPLNLSSNIRPHAAPRTDIEEDQVRALLTNILKDESGVTAIEYALIAALVAVVCITAWKLLGTDLSAQFSTIGSDV